MKPRSPMPPIRDAASDAHAVALARSRERVAMLMDAAFRRQRQTERGAMMANARALARRARAITGPVVRRWFVVGSAVGEAAVSIT